MNELIEYEKGVKDCEEGIPHVDGNGEDYDDGYSHKYKIEQMQSGGFN